MVQKSIMKHLWPMVNSKEISESLVQWVESPENNPEIKIGLYEQKKCELMDHGYIFPSSLADHLDMYFRDLLGIFPFYRCVNINCLSNVLNNGIDVSPSTLVFYATQDIDKAYEYGGDPKLLLILDAKYLERTYMKVVGTRISQTDEYDFDEDELGKFRGIYPTEIKSVDGSRIWFSRLDKNDPRVRTSYESEYAKWIPKNHRECLKGIIIFHSSDQVDQVSKCLR